MNILRNIAIAALTLMLAGPAYAAGEQYPARGPDGGWTFSGFFGRYDDATLQRGYHVFEAVCAACHSLEYVAFRNLAEPGGPGFTMDEVRAIAAQHQVPAGPNEFGEEVDEFGAPLTRTAVPADHFPDAYVNEVAAAVANNGVVPPDLSLMAKARMNGPDYIYSLLTGYYDAPEDVQLDPGQHYNPYFPGGIIAMGMPLFEDGVEYADGTAATVDQMSYDVTNFLMWAAEPKLEKRKRMGFQVMMVLLLLAALLYWSYRRVWADLH